MPENIQPVPPIQNINTKSAYRITTLKVLVIVLAGVVGGSAVFIWMQLRINKTLDLLQIARDKATIAQQGPQYTARVAQEPKFLTESLSRDFDESSYPVTWSDTKAEYSLSGVALGDIDPATSYVFFRQSPLEGVSSIHVLMLKLKITTKQNPGCVEMNLRQTNSNKDLFPPLNPQFYFSGSGGCTALPNTTYKDQKIYFEAAEKDKQFRITALNASGASFTVSFEDPDKIEVVDIDKTYDYKNPVYRDTGMPINVETCANEARVEDVSSRYRKLATTGFDSATQRCILQLYNEDDFGYSVYTCRVPTSYKNVYVASIDISRFCTRTYSTDFYIGPSN